MNAKHRRGQHERLKTDLEMMFRALRIKVPIFVSGKYSPAPNTNIMPTVNTRAFNSLAELFA